MSCPLIRVSELKIKIALNTMESEYIALAHFTRDLIASRGVLQEINNKVFDKRLEEPSLRTHPRTFTQIPQSVVYEDNEACLKFATMTKMSSCTKHIAIPYHFFLSKVNSLEVKVVAIDTNNKKADHFTKGRT